ncbi:hypothetical protein RBSH_05665 [Rhodopirellula baltica SH28]|uniref:Uncharacterized protein n=1 Tax=Rhodopirellula baltica SH28 TaxID=993517 RepID=K5DZV4_RHOBT|nr:hypothetical protein [Rhodopirellula baltica]EKJ99010.1 hypothetical protein RBSH_05665 [Rhodopirellula baltica SH28]
MSRAKTMGFLMVQVVLVCFPVVADEPEKIIEKIQSFDAKASPLTAITGCEHSATCLLGYYDGSIERMDLETGTRTEVCRGVAPIRHIALSNDEQQWCAVVSGQDEEVHLVFGQFDGSSALNVIPLATDLRLRGCYAEFSPDGKFIGISVRGLKDNSSVFFVAHCETKEILWESNTKSTVTSTSGLLQSFGLTWIGDHKVVFLSNQSKSGSAVRIIDAATLIDMSPLDRRRHINLKRKPESIQVPGEILQIRAAVNKKSIIVISDLDPKTTLLKVASFKCALSNPEGQASPAAHSELLSQMPQSHHLNDHVYLMNDEGSFLVNLTQRNAGGVPVAYELYVVHPSVVKLIERSNAPAILLDAENSVRLQHDQDNETSFLFGYAKNDEQQSLLAIRHYPTETRDDGVFDLNFRGRHPTGVMAGDKPRYLVIAAVNVVLPFIPDVPTRKQQPPVSPIVVAELVPAIGS